MRTMRYNKVDGHVDAPMNTLTFLDLVGLVYDAGFVLQHELKVGRRASLDKFNKYFYESISGLLRNNRRPHVPFK